MYFPLNYNQWQNSWIKSQKSVHLQHNRPPAHAPQCCVWKYLHKMFLASHPTLFRVGEGGIVVLCWTIFEKAQICIYFITVQKPFVTDCSSRENTFERTALFVFTRKKCVQSYECYFKVRALKVMVLTVQLSVCCIGK
jgi:hypothetical protein